MTNKLIFETVHGSRLYGLSHENSDTDIYYVYADKRKARQKIEGGRDVTEVGLASFLGQAFSGSHQVISALFSKKKIYHAPEYAPMLERCVVPVTIEVAEKYRREIYKFSFGDFKWRRHALRLALNLHELRAYGRFDPTMPPGKIAYITQAAETYEGADLYQKAAAWGGFSS